MSSLRKRVIKLAYEKKHLRSVLLPVLKEAQFKSTPFPVGGWFGGSVDVIGSPMTSEPYTGEPGTYIQGSYKGKSFTAKYIGRGQFVITRAGSSAAQDALKKVGPQIESHFKLR